MANAFDSGTYRAVLASPKWKRRRALLLRARGERCERCGAVFAPGTGARHLTLHHLTYQRLGCELDEDLQLLCEECHRSADGERAQRSREEAHYAARLQGWVEAVRGEGAEIRPGDEEDFERWLEEHEEYEDW